MIAKKIAKINLKTMYLNPYMSTGLFLGLYILRFICDVVILIVLVKYPMAGWDAIVLVWWGLDQMYMQRFTTYYYVLILEFCIPKLKGATNCAKCVIIDFL